MTRTYRISVLPGDGIGPEVVTEALRVLRAAQDALRGAEFQVHEFECGGQYYVRTGKEWTEEAEEFTKRQADAVLLGAVGAEDASGQPVRLPDGNLAGYNIVLGLRFGLDLYANVRPVRLFEGVPTPLYGVTHKDIDMVIVRENTEGLYTPTRGIMKRGGVEEIAIDTRVITRHGALRVIRKAFRLSMERNGAPLDGVRRVTCVDKSNLLAGCQLFRRVFDEVAGEYPGVSVDYAYVDAWTQWCLRRPQFYDVVVAPNAFGDIITDLGAAIQGGLGVAPAANIGDGHGVFEPVHGSAPRHAGQGTANPVAAVLATSMMLRWLGDRHGDRSCWDAAETVERAVADVLREGQVRTADLCRGPWAAVQPSSTSAVGRAIAERVSVLVEG